MLIDAQSSKQNQWDYSGAIGQSCCPILSSTIGADAAVLLERMLHPVVVLGMDGEQEASQKEAKTVFTYLCIGLLLVANGSPLTHATYTD